VRAAAIALALALPPAAAGGAAEPPGAESEPAPPLPWREPAPPARMFLQLPFEGPSVVETRTLEVELQLWYANSILVASTPSLALDVDLESADVQVLVRYGLARGVEAQLAVPAMVDTGGFLDGPIEAVERAFGATSMPGRLGRPRGLARFRLVRPDGTGVWRDGPAAGLGDVWAGLKVRLLDQTGGWPDMALRAVVKAPTGRVPYGSGELDAGASLSAGWTWNPVGLRLQLDAIAPTAGLRAVRISTRIYGAAQADVAVAVSGGVTLHAQWATHLSPYAATGLPPLDATTHYVIAGASVALSRPLSLEAAAAENVFSPAWGADFTLLLALRARP
jgi:hypothetical protein